jgi:Fe-S-cluster-containing dehydrogenase component
MKAFVIDPSECSGCYSCQLVCKDEHCGNDWTPYAKPQPDTGQFWGKLIETERGDTPQVKVSYVFVPCQHCVDAPCIQSCPVEAIYTRDDGLVIIDPKKCTGCRLCVDSCPYGTIYFNTQLRIAQKCTGCAHLVDRRTVFAPRCADACGHEAILFGEEGDLDISNTETLHPEYELTTRVHYKNLPKKFVAGTVFDSTNKEVVIGAVCELSGAAGNASVTTDDFGDFWIEGLEDGAFTLTITSGSNTKTITGDTTDKDIGLGDIDISV